MRRYALIFALLFAVLPSTAHSALAAPGGDEVFRAIPIQNQGRLKPLDTFGRESLFTIYGKERFDGQSALDVMLTWMHDPKAARAVPVIDVTRQDVRAALELPSDRWISYDALTGNPHFEKMRTDLMQKERSGQDLNALDKQMVRLLNRVSLFSSILTGEAWTIVPDPKSIAAEWKPLTVLDGKESSVSPEAGKAILQAFAGVVEAHAKGDSSAMLQASGDLAQKLAAVGPQPEARVIAMEVEYNDLHPFRWAWIIYLVALLLLIAAGSTKNNVLYGVGFATAVAGFLMHCFGFYLRCVIAGRPPVTNMYESVIYVSLGAILFALLLEAVFRGRTMLMPATAVATLCLIIADNTSSILDPAINPLTPVLRSNFWLTIHVLTITASYGAFLLATALGHVALWTYGVHPEERARQRSLMQQLYKTVQVGVLLLAAGTILGGVWANYSWGRFWGWDPKEVWALIALLGYLSVLHGRYAGWLRDFGFAAGCVIAYCGVLMAWYGVNFVLGAGLHAYGFGEGGQQYVAIAVALDLVFVGIMGARWRAFKSTDAPATEEPAEAE